MIPNLTEAHAARLTEIRDTLINMGSREYVFVGAEIMFYEVIAIARTYGNDESSNRLLLELKKLEAKEYRQTQMLFNKSSQRELVIKRFIGHFVNILKKIPANVSRTTVSG